MKTSSQFRQAAASGRLVGEGFSVLRRVDGASNDGVIHRFEELQTQHPDIIPQWDVDGTNRVSIPLITLAQVRRNARYFGNTTLGQMIQEIKKEIPTKLPLPVTIDEVVVTQDPRNNTSDYYLNAVLSDESLQLVEQERAALQDVLNGVSADRPRWSPLHDDVHIGTIPYPKSDGYIQQVEEGISHIFPESFEIVFGAMQATIPGLGRNAAPMAG